MAPVSFLGVPRVSCLKVNQPSVRHFENGGSERELTSSRLVRLRLDRLDSLEGLSQDVRRNHVPQRSQQQVTACDLSARQTNNGRLNPPSSRSIVCTSEKPAALSSSSNGGRILSV